MIRTAILILLCTVLNGSAQAQERRTGRFAFVPAAEGTLRLDTETGSVSLCSGTGAGVACAEVADQGPILLQMQRRLSAIEVRIERLERAHASRREEDAGPDAEVLGHVAVLSDGAMRRLFRMVERIKNRL